MSCTLLLCEDIAKCQWYDMQLSLLALGNNTLNGTLPSSWSSLNQASATHSFRVYLQKLADL